LLDRALRTGEIRAGRVAADIRCAELQATASEREKMFTRALKEAHAENERLAASLTKTDIISMHVENGELEIATRPPHWAIKAMAASFYDTLDNALNWRSIEVGPMDHEGTRMIVTVRRATGQTPEETVTKLKGTIEKLLACVKPDIYPYTCSEARALLNLTQEK